MQETKIELKIKPDYKKYVNVNRWFSYPCAFYLIIGGRGIGKTTGLNIWNIGDFIKNGNEFLYVRRYITELKKTKTMFDPIINNSVTVQGLSHGLFEWRVGKTRIGYGGALTAQQTFKSGVDFSKVTTLVYDEAILPRGGSYRYLENEIEMLFELISTVFRDRVGYRVFILGNNADIFNPFFDYFKIPKFDKQYIDVERGLYCELAKNSAVLLEAEQQTPLYKLTKGTQYWEYHYNNKVLTVENTRIGPKPMNSQLICRLIINEYTLNIYRYKISEMFVELRNKKIKDSYSFVILENDEANRHYIKEYREADLSKFIRMAYFTGNALFENDKADALFKIFLESV